MGNPMYQCYSSINETLHKDTRSLITANVFYSKSIYKGIYLGLMGDVYHDLNSKETDFSMGVTLIIKHDFFLTRFKEN